MLEAWKWIHAEHPWFFAIVVFVFGACWGSFLNVVIHRVPKKQSVVSPRSYCTTSGKPIPWYDNIPLLSWLLLGGKSRHDKKPISVRYPAVELLTALLFLFCWLLNPPMIALAGFPFIAILIAGTFIDLEHMILPDFSTIGGMLLGLLLSFLIPSLHDYGLEAPFLIEAMRSLITGFIGVLVGSGVILWIAVLAETVLKKEAMGFGDVLFMGCIGAFCGWQGALFAIFGGALLGTLIVIPMLILQKLFGLRIQPGRVENRTWEEVDAAEKEAKTKGQPETGPEEQDLGIGSKISFGPWLALGGVVYFVFAREYVDAYFDTLETIFFGPVW